MISISEGKTNYYKIFTLFIYLRIEIILRMKKKRKDSFC